MLNSIANRYSVVSASLLIILVVHTSSLCADSLINIPVDNELYTFSDDIYDFVARFAAKGVIEDFPKNILPYSRGEVAKILIDLSLKVKRGEVKLSAIEEKRLETMKALFSDKSLKSSKSSKSFHDLHDFSGDQRNSPQIYADFITQMNADKEWTTPWPPLLRGNKSAEISVTESAEISGLLHGFNDFNDMVEARKTKEPLFHIRSDEYHFSARGGVSQGFISRKGESFAVNGTVNITSLRPSISGQVKDSFAFSSDMKWEFHVGDIFSDLFPDETRISYSKLNMENVASMQTYGKFKLPWFELELGKDSIRWGPGYHGQLVISDNPQPMDMVKLGGRYGKIRFQSFTAKLRSSIGDKYISAHRAEGIIWKGIDLGLSEVVVYGDRFEASYLNPFQIYLITEPTTASTAGTTDNVFASIDLSHRPVDNFQVYGELAVDDAAPFKYPLNHWDTKLGILVGLYIVDPFSIPDTDFRIEYAFINQYCYTHEKSINTYKHINSAIGHWLGSDADDLWYELKHRFTDKIESILTYELERHGEGGIDKPHLVGERWIFLSGVTQLKHSLSLGVSYTKIGYYSFRAKYTHSWLRNIDNSEGMDGTGRQVVLEGSYRF